MSAISVNRTYTGRGGTDTYTKQRSYHEVWEVICDNPLDDEEVAGGAVGLPRLGQPHSRYPIARCVEVTAEQSEETPLLWYIYIKYDSNIPLANGLEPGSVDSGVPGGGGIGGELQPPESIPENPLLRPPVWAVTFQKTTEPATEWRLISGGDNLAAEYTAIRNSAKLPFDPPLTIEVSRPVIRVTRNFANIGFPYLARLENALNDRVWRGFPKWTCKIDAVSAGNKYENGIAFVEFSLDIAIKRDTWIPQLLDAGFFALEYRVQPDASFKPGWVKIRDAFGNEATEPQLLNGSGERLSPTGTPIFLKGMPKGLNLENFTDLLGF
jgi:hypothetical protein